MTELELQLRDLAGSVAYPATPDLATTVRARLAQRRTLWSRRPSRRQALAIALAVLAVSAAAVMAVPSARTAVLRFFHIGAVTVQRVDTLPPARERPLTTGLGRRVSLADGARSTGFRMLLPPLDEPPERVYVRSNVQSAFLDVPGAGSVLLTEIRGRNQLDFAKKFSSSETRVEAVTVNGAFGLWLAGGPHVVTFTDGGRLHQFTTRLAGNVLVWTNGDLTLRLEGKLTKQRALALARTIVEPARS